MRPDEVLVGRALSVPTRGEGVVFRRGDDWVLALGAGLSVGSHSMSTSSPEAADSMSDVMDVMSVGLGEREYSWMPA